MPSPYDFSTVQSYFDSIKSQNKKHATGGGSKSTNQKEKAIFIDIDSSIDMNFIGYDKNHNSYWKTIDLEIIPNSEIILIYSKTGDLLDAFCYGKYNGEGLDSIPDRNNYPITGAKVAVSWDGDLYFLQKPYVEYTATDFGGRSTKIIGEKSYFMYKIERRW